MNLINEEQDITILLYLGQDFLDTFLKFTSVLGTCHHTRQIEADNSLLCDCLRNIARYYELRQPLHNRRLSDSRFADQTGIILSSSAENLDYSFHLCLASNHRIQFSFFGKLRQIPAEAVEIRSITFFFSESAGRFLPARGDIIPHGSHQIHV